MEVFGAFHIYNGVSFLFQQMGITQKTEAVGMYSAEGEFVEFGHSVLLEGPVEVEFDSLVPEVQDL